MPKTDRPRCRFFKEGRELSRADLSELRDDLASRIGNSLAPYFNEHQEVYEKL